MGWATVSINIYSWKKVGGAHDHGHAHYVKAATLPIWMHLSLFLASIYTACIAFSIFNYYFSVARFGSLDKIKVAFRVLFDGLLIKYVNKCVFPHTHKYY